MLLHDVFHVLRSTLAKESFLDQVDLVLVLVNVHDKLVDQASQPEHLIVYGLDVGVDLALQTSHKAKLLVIVIKLVHLFPKELLEGIQFGAFSLPAQILLAGVTALLCLDTVQHLARL